MSTPTGCFWCIILSRSGVGGQIQRFPLYLPHYNSSGTTGRETTMKFFQQSNMFIPIMHSRTRETNYGMSAVIQCQLDQKSYYHIFICTHFNSRAMMMTQALKCLYQFELCVSVLKMSAHLHFHVVYLSDYLVLSLLGYWEKS